MKSVSDEQLNATCQLIRERLADVLAVYVFGSQATDTATPESDTDLAVLVEGYADSNQLFVLAGVLSDILKTPVDLVDFRAATTVLQAQILNEGLALWRSDTNVEAYERAIMRDKYDLDIRRKDQLLEVKERGFVYDK